MTKKELERGADDEADRHAGRVPQDGSKKFYDDVDFKASKEGYLAGAEPREKRIAELEAIARNTKATDESFALLTIQLIEAKKIIRSLLTCCRNYPQENAEKMRQAEKFIKDSEVVK